MICGRRVGDDRCADVGAPSFRRRRRRVGGAGDVGAPSVFAAVDGVRGDAGYGVPRSRIVDDDRLLPTSSVAFAAAGRRRMTGGRVRCVQLHPAATAVGAAGSGAGGAEETLKRRTELGTERRVEDEVDRTVGHDEQVEEVGADAKNDALLAGGSQPGDGQVDDVQVLDRLWQLAQEEHDDDADEHQGDPLSADNEEQIVREEFIYLFIYPNSRTIKIRE